MCINMSGTPAAITAIAPAATTMCAKFLTQYSLSYMHSHSYDTTEILLILNE